ncbi:hypothetical protein PVK06_030667 [Gossypium arboreum]|uniref:Uncharacterized protein n=1 Tax=Gossypium arboreum TaxID=29729 RepID=A0ABR0NNW0_GOSAR|nr:hypothetical protein PVK06_030667 [Gossypium arboreum]
MVRDSYSGTGRSRSRSNPRDHGWIVVYKKRHRPSHFSTHILVEDEKSPNDCRVANLMLAVNPRNVKSTNEAWPYRFSNDLALILVERREEPINYFYSTCKMHPQRWSLMPTIDQGESSSRALVPRGANIVLTAVGSSNYSILSQYSQHENMDVESLMDNVREYEEVVAPQTQPSTSGCKRPRVEERSQSTENSSCGRLIHHR